MIFVFLFCLFFVCCFYEGFCFLFLRFSYLKMRKWLRMSTEKKTKVVVIDQLEQWRELKFVTKQKTGS